MDREVQMIEKQREKEKLIREAEERREYEWDNTADNIGWIFLVVGIIFCALLLPWLLQS